MVGEEICVGLGVVSVSLGVVYSVAQEVEDLIFAIDFFCESCVGCCRGDWHGCCCC